MGRQSGGEVQRRRSGTASGDGVGVEAAMAGRRREEAEAGRGGGVDGAALGGVGLLWIPIQIGREEGGVVGRVGVGVG